MNACLSETNPMPSPAPFIATTRTKVKQKPVLAQLGALLVNSIRATHGLVTLAAPVSVTDLPLVSVQHGAEKKLF